MMDLSFAPGKGQQIQTTDSMPFCGKLTVSPGYKLPAGQTVYIQLAKNSGTGDYQGAVSPNPNDFSTYKTDTQTMSWHVAVTAGQVLYVNIRNSDVPVSVKVTTPKSDRVIG
jgi:hypothetical protein